MKKIILLALLSVLAFAEPECVEIAPQPYEVIFSDNNNSEEVKLLRAQVNLLQEIVDAIRNKTRNAQKGLNDV